MSVDLNLLKIVSDDRALGASMLFKHRHPQESAPMHTQMMDAWSGADEFVLIEAFRKAAKSTTCEEALIMEGAFGNFHYWLLIGETYDKAVQRLQAIDYEARTNVKLHHLFGNKVLARKSTENKMFFRSGAVIQALGWEQELQSFKHHEFRPDGVWLDDIENKESVRDSAAVEAGMRKFFLELLPALGQGKRRIRFTQTRRAEDCMVTRLAVNPEWLYIAFPVCDGDPDDPNTKSNWPGNFPMDWVRREKRMYESAGKLQEFKQAFMLDVSNPEGKPFKDEMIQGIDISPWHWMARYAIYDPARTANKERTKKVGKSDRYGKVVVSKLGSKILVHESSGNFWQPDEMIDDLFATNERHALAKLGIEKNSLDDWIMQPIRLKMMTNGQSLPLVALTAPQDRSKEDFILGLQPFFEAGDVVLVGGRVAHPQLVAEALNFPQGSRDILNALAYSLKMFSGQTVYPDFNASNIGEAPEPKRGETVYVGFHANAHETVCVALLRDGRRLTVAFDAVRTGSDAVKDLAFELRAHFPLAAFSIWSPAEVHDQWQRIPLIPSLRAERLSVYRGEHTAVAKGCLSDRIRMEWHGKKLLIVDRDAKLTLNSLSVGYAHEIKRGGTVAPQPEEGTSRLIAEAIESMVAILDKSQDAGVLPAGAHTAVTPDGYTYVTARPQRR